MRPTGSLPADDSLPPALANCDRSSAGGSGKLPLASRWGNSNTDCWRFRVTLSSELGVQNLGLCVDRRCGSGAPATVLAVRQDSAASVWNANCWAKGRSDLVVQPGDIIVEANGRRIGCARDFRKALEASASSTLALVCRRETPPLSPLDSEKKPSPSWQRDSERRPSQCRRTLSRPSSRTPSHRTHGREGDQLSFESPAARRFLSSTGRYRTADVEAEDAVPLRPGRCCRAVQPPFGDAPRITPERSFKLLPAAGAVQQDEVRSTFGCEARFWEERPTLEVDSARDMTQEAFLLCPSDRFLSTKVTPKVATFAPPSFVKPGQLRDAKRWLQKVAGEKGSEVAVALASAPGLRGITSAWQALLREEMQDEEAESTDAGSELESEMTSFWSSEASEAPAPGPGFYEPGFASVEPSRCRGTPSFSRYSAREPRFVSKRDLLDSEEQRCSEQMSGSASSSSAGLLPASSCTGTVIAPSACRGGKIAPLPGSRPRVPTAAASQASAAAERPFYDANHALVEPSVPVPSMCPGSSSRGFVGARGCETGRLEHLVQGDNPGPGSYQLTALVPGGQAAVIAPDSQSTSKVRLAARARSEPPGPATYDFQASLAASVYPRASAAGFGESMGHSMEFQRTQVYTSRYGALDPRWEAIHRRSYAALILPEPDALSAEIAARQSLRAPHGGTGAAIGPATYDVDEHLTQRLRPDVSVLPWVARSSGVAEHTAALFSERPVDSAVRGDPRPLLGPDGDLAVRRRHADAIIQPLSEPSGLQRLRRSWAAGDTGWTLYGPVPEPAPTGLSSFSRGLALEAWSVREDRWRALEERGKRRNMPNLQLAYSLPSLETTRLRAPSADFTRIQGRPASDIGAGDSPREGDVLLLSLQGEREVLHPRVPAPVDMARQLGREDNTVPAEVDDFEELVLSPRPTQRRVPVFVNMAKTQGRPEVLELDAHIWEESKERGGGVYTYRPTTGLLARDPGGDLDELDLQVAPGKAQPSRRPPSVDFSQPLGRAGVDPRIADSDPGPWGPPGGCEETVLTNWRPRFRGRSPEGSAA